MRASRAAPAEAAVAQYYSDVLPGIPVHPAEMSAQVEIALKRTSKTHLFTKKRRHGKGMSPHQRDVAHGGLDVVRDSHCLALGHLLDRSG
eukprot:2864536-Pyramimonas_sp.AAC.1